MKSSENPFDRHMFLNEDTEVWFALMYSIAGQNIAKWSPLFFTFPGQRGQNWWTPTRPMRGYLWPMLATLYLNSEIVVLAAAIQACSYEKGCVENTTMNYTVLNTGSCYIIAADIKLILCQLRTS